MPENTIQPALAVLPYSLPAETVQKFWDLVDKSEGVNGCWPWMGQQIGDGYGMFKATEQIQTAHRIAWQITHGQTLARFEFVCHSCDFPPCCNPRHLWVGSPKDNMRDARRKGRLNGRKGIPKVHRPKPSDMPLIPVRASKQALSSPRTKLKPEQVGEIRQRRKAGEMVRVLAADYNISTRSILKIVKGETWA